MSNRDMYRTQASFGNHLYEFLFDLAKELYPDIDGVRSCTQARYTYSAGRNDTNWCDHQHDLFSLCNSYFKNCKTCKSQNGMRECTQKLVHSLFKEKNSVTKKKPFCGVGAMGAIQFVHSSSLLGLIPLHCYNFAELFDDSLGPSRFIRIGLKNLGKRCLLTNVIRFYVNCTRISQPCGGLWLLCHFWRTRYVN